MEIDNEYNFFICKISLKIFSKFENIFAVGNLILFDSLIFFFNNKTLLTRNENFLNIFLCFLLNFAPFLKININ